MRGFPDRKCHVQNISQGVAILSGKFCVRTVLVRVRHAAVPGGRQASPSHTHILQGSWCFTSSRPRSVGASRAAITGVRRLDSGDRDRPGCSHAHPGARPRRSSAVCSASGTTPHAIPRGPWVTTVRSGKNDANVSNPLAPIGQPIISNGCLPSVGHSGPSTSWASTPPGTPACSPPPSPPPPFTGPLPSLAQLSASGNG